MMNRNQWRAFAFLAILAVLTLHGGASSSSWAQPASHARPNERGGMQNRTEMMIQQLDLTPEQRPKVQAIMQQSRQEGQALSQQLRAKRNAMMDYLKSLNATEATAMTMSTEVNMLQKRLSELRVKTWFAIRAELTPAQIQKMNQMGDLQRSKPSAKGGKRSHVPCNDWERLGVSHRPDLQEPSTALTVLKGSPDSFPNAFMLSTKHVTHQERPLQGAPVIGATNTVGL